MGSTEGPKTAQMGPWGPKRAQMGPLGPKGPQMEPLRSQKGPWGPMATPWGPLVTGGSHHQEFNLVHSADSLLGLQATGEYQCTPSV